MTGRTVARLCLLSRAVQLSWTTIGFEEHWTGFAIYPLFKMKEKEMVSSPPRTQAEKELAGQAARQIQLRWFSSIVILEIRFRWLAAAGVLVATWFTSSFLNIITTSWPLYIVGTCMLAYNTLLWLYLEKRFPFPIRARSLGYEYDDPSKFYWKNLEQEELAHAYTFHRFVQIQTSLDWLAMILLVHFSGGIESPLLFYFIFHLIIASILLSPRACYFFASVAALAVATLAILEYARLVPHISMGFISEPLYQSEIYIISVLFFFITSLYISVYLTTYITSNLRQRDKKLLRLQRQLSGAYQQIETLYKVTKTVSSTLDLEEVLNLVAQSAAKAMQIKACIIRLLNENGQTMDIVASHGLSEQYLAKGPIDIRKSRFMYQTVTSGQPTIISDTASDNRLQYPVETRAEGINSMLCVPLLIRGKTEGVLCVFSAKPDYFNESDAEFLSALAGGGATAIENARTYQALEMADRAKSDFVRMVTHELRSPLSAVQSMLRLLEQGYVGTMTSKQQNLVQRSQRRISFLLALVKDLLELAAGKMERIRGEVKEVELDKILTQVIELMQASAKEKGLHFEIEIGQGPFVLIGVKDGLERVLMNLVSNAIKYTPKGGTVTIKAWSEKNQIKIVVSDTGIGIPKEALPRIFTEFYRAKNAKALEMEGTGLGLAIAKDVIEQHGGQISLESTEGKGSTFYVTLPKITNESARPVSSEPSSPQ